MAGWLSTVPDTMDALATLFSAAVDPSVLVADGPNVGGDGQTKSVLVGYDGNDGAVHIEWAPADGGLALNRESYTVFCSVNVADGSADGNWSSLRQEAFDLYSTLTAALAGDPTLGRTVMRAMPGSVAAHQTTTRAGRLVIIAFGVQVEAFTKEV
jgi:hypothetical protein